MKKTIIAMTALAIAFGVTSCNKENPAKNITAGDKAYITIDIQGNETRAAGDPTDAGDSKINTLGVFVFNGNTDASICISKLNVTIPMTDNKALLETTDNAKYVFVVANAGDISLSTNSLNAIANVGALKAAVADLGGTAATQTAGNVLMTSADLIALSAFAGDPKTATATAIMQFVGAKVILKWDEGTDFAASANWTFDLFVNQANAKALFLGNAAARSVVSSAGFYSAIATTQNPASVTNVVSTTLTDTGIAKLTPCHYYLFGNNAVTKPTIVGIAARNSSTLAVRYFAISLDGGASANSNTLVAGKAYEITIRLKGDLDNGGGTIDPEDKPANIQINISPADWGPRIVIDKEV